jgi:hypothetical protein
MASPSARAPSVALIERVQHIENMARTCVKRCLTHLDSELDDLEVEVQHIYKRMANHRAMRNALSALTDNTADQAELSTDAGAYEQPKGNQPSAVTADTVTSSSSPPDSMAQQETDRDDWAKDKDRNHNSSHSTPP